MRDLGLEQAIEAAGGVGALARLLNIAQPSVSSWKQVPPERVLNIEMLTGVSRHSLRPDLYPQEADDIDKIRFENYNLLSILMGKAPNADILNALKSLQGDASPLGMSYIELAQAAHNNSEEKIGREFFNLFVGVGRGEYLPYASFYLTGFLHDKPLAKVRADMIRLGFERADQLYEPEDHIAILCEVMSMLVLQPPSNEVDEAKLFFTSHIKPWAVRFFAELEMAQSASFYKAVGQFGRCFMEIEADAFTLN